MLFCNWPEYIGQSASTIAPCFGSSSTYCTQFDSTSTVFSDCLGSFVMRYTRKSCLPPISPCIMNCMEIVVFSPGLRTIDPMAGVGGQHPSMTSMYGFFVKRSG